jgi:DNA repair exonuclease SbcCD nuclease subunit
LVGIKNSLYEVGEFCRTNNIKNIIFAGDILHNKSIIYSIAQNIFLDFLKHYDDMKFLIIDGNHDLSGKSGKVVSGLKPLESIKHVEWITATNGTTHWRNPDDILFVPYSEHMSDIIKKEKAKILISHFGLNEAMLSSGVSIRTNISVNDLKGHYKCAILGHYHKPQEYIDANIKVYYVGSLTQLDWGEKDEIKRILVLNTETLEIDSHPIKSYKKHIEIEVTNKNKKEALAMAVKEKELGNHVKLIITEKVVLPTDMDIRVVDKTERDITNRGITGNMNQAERLKKYLMIKEVDSKEHEIYLQTANDIIGSCMEVSE